MLGMRSEVWIGHEGLDARHERLSPNKSKRIRCLVLVKSRWVMVDRMLSKESLGRLKSIETSQG